MKITVITPVYNGEETIKACIESVLNQTHSDIEYIIMDSCSKDNTLDIVKSYPQQRIKLISEKDKGSNDALSKGIKIATGDVVCMMCSDDLYAHNNVLKKVTAAFEFDKQVDIVYSDIVYVNRKNINKVDRYWKSASFKSGMYRKGWLPPHTSFFIKREALKKYGDYNGNFIYAADYDLSYRLLEVHRLKSHYIPEIFVKMRSGGMSNASIKGIYESLKDVYRVLKSHRVKAPIIYIVNTILYRLNQFFISSKVKNI